MQQLNARSPIVLSDLTMSQEFREFVNALGRQLPFTGEGSPEGVVEAPLYAIYLDTNGLPGQIEYRKMQDQIGGDKTLGWALS